MDPSPGNITPSCPVAIAHGIRKTRKPMIHQPYAAGPAGWMAAELVMNKTIATKIATMSNVVSTRGRIPPATRSEVSSLDSVSAVMAVLLGLNELPRQSRYHSGVPRDKAPGQTPVLLIG